MFYAFFMMKAPFHIGFDLGGTKMIAELIDAEDNIIASVRAKTPSEAGAEAVCKAMTALTLEACSRAKIKKPQLKAIGVAVPGIIDPKSGNVSLTNLNLKNYPLRSKLESALGVKVILENDVNSGLWAEYKTGAAKGFRHVVGVFVGTGIGGGLILDGQLYRGRQGAAGEIGHMIIMEGGPLCGCGQYGCLEALASRTAMAKDAVALATAGRLPELANKVGTDFKRFKSSLFEKALDKGNVHIAKIIDRAAYHLGIGLANLAMIFNPEAFIIGGGFANRLRKHYLEIVSETMRSHAMPAIVQDLPIIIGSLGDDAVPLGAALLAKAEAN